ncbi:hypothetical protein FKW77_008600 [Venturia effusa]|uniref:Uncharacterized protein n=1 Tax=Venturia effusa TaxID=50376 RepID=A0A517LBE8_9PEZI|nr:hypothetical protein FKW77_008600 [Venturia effusa]
MENPLETEIIKRWALADRERQQQDPTSATAGASRKRPRRAIENGDIASSLPGDIAAEPSGTNTGTTRRTAAAGRRKKDARTRITDVIEVDEMDEELEEVGSGVMGFFTRK